MSTQIPQNVSSSEGTQNSNSLWDLAGKSGSSKSGTGVYYNVVTAIAGNMDMVMQILNTNTNELVVLMQGGQDLMKEMKDRANNDDLSYTESAVASGQVNLSTQMITASASEISTRMGQNSQVISGDKTMGNAFTQMFSTTSRSR